MRKKKKPDRRNQAFRFITLEVEIMKSSKVAQVLIKKKPEARLSDFLVQKHFSGFEHVSESSTSNRRKKARELRSGFLDIQHLRGEYMEMNLTQQAVQDNSNNDFLHGDTVVLIAPVTLVNRVFDTGDLLSVEYITPLSGIGVTTNGVIVVVVDPIEIRHASTLELKLKRRLSLTEQALAEVP
jgi:hypothetical protein